MIQRLQKTNKTYIDKNGTLWQVRRTDEGYNCFFHFGTERLSVGWQEGRLPRRKKAWESQKDLDIYAENHRMSYFYTNEDKECECWLCELSGKCNVVDKSQRFPRPCGLGLCKKI